MTGIVKTYNAARGFGIIQPLIGDPNADTVFFHVTAIKGDIPVRGSEVTFRLVRGPNGKPQAAAVQMLELGAKILRTKSA